MVFKMVGMGTNSSHIYELGRWIVLKSLSNNDMAASRQTYCVNIFTNSGQKVERGNWEIYDIQQ